MAEDGVRYEFKTVQAVRGTEARSIAKWQTAGWEHLDQKPGSLRTTLQFRRVKPKAFSDYFMDSVAAFSRLRPKARLALAGSAAAILVAGTIGVAAGSQDGGDNSDVSAASVARSEDASEPTLEVAAAAAEPYAYQGPRYEIVTIDKDAGMGELDQYWVYTGKLDYSTDAYRDQIKLLIADVARKAQTDELIVQVVTDKEIIEAESNDTISGFMDSHDTDYWNDVMVPKEKSDWVAWYSGGIDHEAGELSDSNTAFGIDWWVAGDAETEKWRPEIAG